MAERKAQNEKAEAKDTNVENLDGPEVKGGDSVSVDDLVAKQQLPKGDNVSVGGPADEVGELEIVVEDSMVAPGIAASQGGEPVPTVFVLTDKVVTDPLGPLGVQIPSSSVNDVHLPIHDLAKGTPEQQFESGTADESKGGMLQDKSDDGKE
jgi:hypothetical protein